MADFRDITVVEVDKDNFKDLWPNIMSAIKSATYVAIDAELSGIGEKKLLFAKSVEDRYKEMSNAAKTRSVISLGLSCFKLMSNISVNQPNNMEDEATNDSKMAPVLNFQVQTFNLMVLCSENYLVEPCSLKFLIEHGFDFNKQYEKGISYYRGSDQKEDYQSISLRRLFTELVLNKVPIVLHNALVDLVFMYQSFYANLPASFQSFLADMMEIFSGGVYDTKYIAEFKARMAASYLEYVFRKSQRLNSMGMKTGGRYISVEFLDYPSCMGDSVLILPCALDDHPEESQVGKLNACMGYAAHGWCPRGNSCEFSHDIDIILDSEEKIMTKTQKKRQKKKQKQLKSQLESEKRIKMDDNHHIVDGVECSLSIESNVYGDFEENCSESNESDLNGCTDVASMLIDESTLMPTTKDSDDQTKTNAITETGNSVQAAQKGVNIVRKTGGHRAGFDSFMTGFAFATFIAKYGKGSVGGGDSSECTLGELGVADFMNKVALSGKDIPLLIQKGNFAKNSKDHVQKYNTINKIK